MCLQVLGHSFFVQRRMARGAVHSVLVLMLQCGECGVPPSSLAPLLLGRVLCVRLVEPLQVLMCQVLYYPHAISVGGPLVRGLNWCRSPAASGRGEHRRRSRG